MEVINFLNYARLNISKEDIGKLKDALDVLDKYMQRTIEQENDIFNESIHIFNYSVRTHNWLIAAGLENVGQLMHCLNERPKKLLRIKNLGLKTYKEIVESIITHKELRKYLWTLDKSYGVGLKDALSEEHILGLKS